MHPISCADWVTDRYHQLAASSCLLDDAVLYRRHFVNLNSCFDIIIFHSIQCKASFDASRSATLLISSYSPNVDKIHNLSILLSLADLQKLTAHFHTLFQKLRI
jgi:hypothetical protein